MSQELTDAIDAGFQKGLATFGGKNADYIPFWQKFQVIYLAWHWLLRMASALTVEILIIRSLWIDFESLYTCTCYGNHRCRRGKG